MKTQRLAIALTAINLVFLLLTQPSLPAPSVSPACA